MPNCSMTSELFSTSWSVSYRTISRVESYIITSMVSPSSMSRSSGLWSGRIRSPSTRKRTAVMLFPCRSQYVSINFFKAVPLLILKKTSLLSFYVSIVLDLSGHSWPLNSELTEPTTYHVNHCYRHAERVCLRVHTLRLTCSDETGFFSSRSSD